MITPELLPGNMAQVATNAILYKGGVAPLKLPVTVATPTKSGPFNAIYRFGKSLPETEYWFTWPSSVYACRGSVIESTERTYYSGDGTPKKTDFSLALAGGTNYPVASYELGIPAPVTAPTLTYTATTTGAPSIQEQRAYVTTNVSIWGEESGPSPAVVGTADASGVLQLTAFAPIPAGAYAIQKRYIYRTVTSTSGTNYYWVGEVGTGTSEVFLDNVDVTAIGEALVTLDWDYPPSDLAGLISLPSGALCGFSGKQVCFSVVNAPYAWPTKYRLTCDYDIVAVAAAGQGVYVMTTGNPYFINTGDPESAQMVRIDEEQPCIAARSVVTIGGSVIYASPTGLVSVSSTGSVTLTAKIYDKDAWQATNPRNLIAGRHDGRYHGFFAGGGGFTLDDSGNFIPHDITATAVFTDPVLDQMYIAVWGNIQKWNAGDVKTTTWKSKLHRLPVATNFSCFKVNANSYLNLQVKVTAYLDTADQANKVAAALGSIVTASGNAIVYTATVGNSEDQRMPSGFLSKLWEFEVIGTDHWTVCAFANDPSELQSV